MHIRYVFQRILYVAKHTSEFVCDVFSVLEVHLRKPEKKSQKDDAKTITANRDIKDVIPIQCERGQNRCVRVLEFTSVLRQIMMTDED